MNEEAAKFKKEKQLPAPEHKKGKKGKPSGKKPWTIECEWKAGSVLTRRVTTKIGSEWVEEIETKTIEEIRKDKGVDTFFWGWDLWAGHFSNYKTRRDALQAWENFKNKPKLSGERYEIDERKIYTLVNKKTGQKEVL
jgi:hypothetical protein